ncbi:SDR family NAD(P)-dependent oxidoreductase [aff. Roholtiella sp. LEGE 12411]|uniref:SDR family NAD(P)-dependent oxidoreductase n=1 Tax=aff. Roholtiella sp. LEGE 12411 TaxID=1828822 RepID=UPI0018801335|nr:SDR family NAD(P)-dependent oxidoreductase [aff. Roholtiella sp. LEGE 12411]MBE9033942.1 SDR family NAD(P)-dependent oxidoreductase [aff. Roholtiella sp. LEGE 12411]
MTQTAQLSPSSVFVVSGGAKGITAECTIKLAQYQPCKFILLGRSELLETEPDFAQGCFEDSALKKRIMENLLALGEKPTPMSVQKVYNKITSSREIQKTLCSIQLTGAQVEYISVDVTEPAALQEKLAAAVQRLGAITGIIHGAGNLADKLIEKKTEQDFEKVYAAKVQGLENLLSCVNPEQLQHLVLFSSVTGFYGNVGQTDYAIANEILNKSAHLIKQNYPACHAVAINWGAWDSGMVTPELKKAFAERGIEIIPVEVGTQMLVNELHPNHHHNTQVVIGSRIRPTPAPLDSQLRSYRIRRRMTLEENPFLYDHVIAGSPVLPATCAMSWMINACEELYPGYKCFSFKNFKVLKGIIFNETLASEYILELQEVEHSNSDSLELQTTILSKNSEEKIHYHFQACIKLVKEIPAIPIYESMNLMEDNIINTTGKDFYQNGNFSLFHGSSFQQITRVLNISQEKITIECLWQEITSKQQGQFPIQWFNPYTTDLSTQSLWIWLSHFHQELCLPGQLRLSEQFAVTPCNEPFYVSCEIKGKNESSVTANFILHNRQGQIYTHTLEAKAVILPMQLLRRN